MFADRRDRIDWESDEFLWRQLADDLAREIESGKLAPGTRLPSIDALADAYGLARGTVRRALAYLSARGLVATRQGRGTFVRRRRDDSANG